jgi:serralysin
MQHANVFLTFIDDPEQADIRISFRYPGCWSTVGTTCRTQTRSRPTMNFSAARLRRITAEEARGVVLHEFGHALGLIHEHQQPLTPLQFNKQRVIADVQGPPNDWTPEQIERNIFKPAAAAETNASAYDRDSIMMYPIPPQWLLNPGEATEENHEISPQDHAFIGTQYPRPGQP